MNKVDCFVPPMKVSVIIPVRNEERSIRVLLDSLLSQTLPADEIIITDGGSTDSTRDIIRKYIAEGSPIHLIQENVALPGRGRNLGAQQARNDWIAFTDAGIRPAKDWLAALCQKARERSPQVIYGAWEPVTDSWFKMAAAIAYVPSYVQLDGSRLRPRFIASTLMLRSVWQAVGGFREDLRSAEDLLFMNNIEAARYRIAYAPEAVVHWELQPTTRDTFRRFRTYSRHAMKAGLGGQWQSRVSLMYLLMLLACVAAPWWWPLISVPVLIPLARAARRIHSWYSNETIWRRGIRLINPIRVLTVAWITIVIDVAMFCGMFDWYMRRQASGN